MKELSRFSFLPVTSYHTAQHRLVWAESPHPTSSVPPSSYSKHIYRKCSCKWLFKISNMHNKYSMFKHTHSANARTRTQTLLHTFSKSLHYYNTYNQTIIKGPISSMQNLFNKVDSYVKWNLNYYTTPTVNEKAKLIASEWSYSYQEHNTYLFGWMKSKFTLIQ